MRRCWGSLLHLVWQPSRLPMRRITKRQLRRTKQKHEADSAASKAATSGSARIVEAAKSGDARKLRDQIVTTRNYLPDHMTIEVANEALSSLVTEKVAFAAALDELRYRVLNPDWQPPAQLLEELLKNNQRESIELLIAGNLDMELLTRASAKVPNDREWVGQRTTEVPIRRAIQGQLTTAARTGDLAGINRLVDAGADINGTDKDGGYGASRRE